MSHLTRFTIALLLVATASSTTPAALADDKAKPGREETARVSKKTENTFPPFKTGELIPAGLGPRQATPDIPFPGGATARSIPRGKAVLAILVEADGRAVDTLVISATDPVFGKALADFAPKLAFAAAKFKGTAVPGRYTLGYEFESEGLSMNVMDQTGTIPGKIAAGKAAYAAHLENELDQKLELTRMALPDVPAGYTPPNDQPVMVLVSFFVDESGRARIPNVESAADPVLVPGAIAAVSQWTFKPATLKGKAVLVYAARPVRFLPAPPKSP